MTTKHKKQQKKRPKSSRPTISMGDFHFGIAHQGLSGNRVSMAVAKTINLGNYESIRVEYGISRVVPDGEKFETVWAACEGEALSSLTNMIHTIEETMK